MTPLSVQKDRRDKSTFRDLRVDDPISFPAPSPEVMAELRRLLPPVPPVVVERAA